VPASVPASVRATLRRCLQKDPKQRLRDIGDVQFELGETETSDRALLPQSSTASSRGREYLAWTVATVAIALAVGVMWVHTPQEESRASTVARTAILLPTDHMLASSEGASSLTVSQDGARIAYVAEQDGRRQLYVRDLSELEPRALAGSEGARDPFFSPDGQWLAYFANGALQKVAVTGGAPLRICNVASVSAGGSWASGDTIVFAVGRQSGWRRPSPARRVWPCGVATDTAGWPDGVVHHARPSDRDDADRRSAKTYRGAY
jgi:serine/threonine-protein kinase